MHDLRELTVELLFHVGQDMRTVPSKLPVRVKPRAPKKIRSSKKVQGTFTSMPKYCPRPNDLPMRPSSVRCALSPGLLLGLAVFWGSDGRSLYDLEGEPSFLGAYHHLVAGL
jgi:hypothetical protein